MAGAPRTPAQADSLSSRPAPDAAQERPASADLRPHRESDVLDRKGAARNHAGILSRRESLPSTQARARGRIPGDRLPARPLGLRPAGTYGTRLDSGTLHQPRAAG